MKFNSQICTTKEQSERLLALGLKKETADMALQTTLDVCYTIPFQEAVEYFENRHLPPHPTLLPAWSLHRLIEIYKTVEDISLWSLDFVNYNRLIQCIGLAIKHGAFNNEYLEE